MINKIDHIGIAVRSLESAQEFYEGILGLEKKDILEIPDRGVRIALFEAGNNTIELIEPMGSDSPVAKFLEKRGEGLHHIAFHVPDIEKAMARLKEKGVELVTPRPQSGAHNKKIVFLSPKGSHGVLIELCQTT